jgi:Tol biopolymer transport system component
MSPEQARGLEVDERSDVWSLGVVLYEMLSGDAPFTGETMSDTIAFILHRNPPPLSERLPGAPEEVERIVSKALEKDREDRHQTAKDMLADLRRFRKRYEQQVELERSGAPSSASGGVIASSGGVRASTAAVAAASTGEGGAHTTGSLGLVAGGRGKVALVALLLALVATGGGYALYQYSARDGSTPKSPRVSALAEMKFTRLPIGGGTTIGGAISPDGKFLIRAVREGGKQSLRLRQVTGTTEKDIVSFTDANLLDANFSPDGGTIYYASKRRGENVSQLYRVPVLGGDAERIGSDINFGLRPSPDGKRLAFLRAKQDESSIVLINAGGGGEQTLLTRKSPASVFDLTWSPDGRVIGYVIYDIDAEGYFFNIEAANVADGTTHIVSSARWRTIPGMAWLADGSGLILCARDRASLPNTPAQLWHVAYPGGAAQKITNDLNYYEGVSLTADSRTALVGRKKFTANIWVAPGGDAARARQVTHEGPSGDEGVTWTPDGRLVYMSDASGNTEIWTANADGGGAKQLTFDSFADNNPVVSPDGRFVVFMTNRSVGWSLWRMNADGGDARELARNIDQHANPNISPDSRWVFYSSRDGGKPALWKISAEGGAPMKRLEKNVWSARVSPDGSRLAVFYRGADPDSPPQLWILPVEGGEPVHTFDLPPDTSGKMLSWSPDGKDLDFIVRREGVSNIWRQPSAGGKPRQLTDWKSDLLFWFAWSRDGKQLAASRGTEDYELVLIENFR